MEEIAITKKKSFIDDYVSENTYDEMVGENSTVAKAWQTLANNLEKMGLSNLINNQTQINRILSENGVTYNVYGRADSQRIRNWTLNTIPWIIDEEEWKLIEKGIIQRALLFNEMLKDIYGKRTLIKDGFLPYELVYGHKGFLRQCNQIAYPNQNQISIYATDMARGPDNRIWVINDRTQAPSGMGYALENRLTIAKVMPELFEGLHVKRYSSFYNHFKKMLKDSSPKRKDNPFIVVLTPGPYNETYFEHSYLASFLGYPLVQGSDMVARDGYLWLKSLKGLTQIDVVLRRVDDVFCDPLELREDSWLGVAGLMNVVRKGNVAIINPIGAGVVENPGLIPFLPSIAKVILGEDLILPQIATWWCGQKKEMDFVLENINHLIIKYITQTNEQDTFIGPKLTKSQREELKKRILKTPYMFVGQEQVNFSTTPTLVENRIEPRKSIWRAFAVSSSPSEYYVMPGGLIRVAVEKECFFVSNQSGGTSKDLWVTCKHPDIGVKLSSIAENYGTQTLITGLDSLPSQTGENLFWVGRYTARALIVARYIRTLIRKMTENNETYAHRESFNILCKGLTAITLTYPGFFTDSKTKLIYPKEEIRSVLLDGSRIGSLAQTMNMLKNLNFCVRNFWSQDTWIVFDRLIQHWESVLKESPRNPVLIITSLDELISRLVAFMWLVEDSMFEEQGLVLYFLGLRIEEVILISNKIRTCFSKKYSEELEYELMEATLRNSESLNTYRMSYRSSINIESFLDLLLMEERYPKSLANKLNKLVISASKLPRSGISRGLSSYEKLIYEARLIIQLSSAEEIASFDKNSLERNFLDNSMNKIMNLMMQCSDTIAQNYFIHVYQSANKIMEKE